jgi:branched-chain amino acid transport system permease protein
LTAAIDIVMGGLFHAAILFLVSAGLQLVFGVQKILNLACGSFYALGAYFGITAVTVMTAQGLPIVYFFPVLVAAGLLIGVVGLPVERLLRPVYRRDESNQLLLTFGLLLMFQDVIRYFWGASPQTLDKAYVVYGTVETGGVHMPVYNLLVIAVAIGLASAFGFFLQRTAFGRIVRATAENRDMAEGIGANTGRVYAFIFTTGCMLGTLGGALVAPASAASLEMAVELIVEAFAVVVIGGLGSMRGALLGALIVGLVRAVAISALPEAEVLSFYAIVIAVLIVRPVGLLGKATA